MDTVTSKDGTSIAIERSGDGPPVVLVCGGSVDRTSNAPLAAALSEGFAVFNYDRRGRGDSGDTPPYAVEREVEDIDAVIANAGGSAFLYGSSSGGALALEAAAAGLPVVKMALWEPPFVPEGGPRPPADTAKTFADLVAAGRRGDAVEFFMSDVVGMPDEFVTQARSSPWWPAQEALAHTLAYDATIMSDYWLPTERAASVKVPTIVLAGGASFPWIIDSAKQLAGAIPDADARILEGQTHDVSAEALAPALGEFFTV
ncbi:MAG: alpha/beta hydrolase [Actinomycetota bacterium]